MEIISGREVCVVKILRFDPSNFFILILAFPCLAPRMTLGSMQLSRGALRLTPNVKKFRSNIPTLDTNN